MGGSVESLHLVLGGKRCLEEKATYHVGGGANHAFSSVILMGGESAREPQPNTGRKSKKRSVRTQDHYRTGEHE